MGGGNIFLQKIYIIFSLEWFSYGFVETVVYSLSIFHSTLLRGNNCFPSRFFYSKIIQSIRVAVFACREVHAGRQYDIKAMDAANVSMEGGVHSMNKLDHFIASCDKNHLLTCFIPQASLDEILVGRTQILLVQ